MATFFLHRATEKSFEHPEVFALARYLFGFLIFSLIYFKARGIRLPAVPSGFILLRALFNVLAVFCFYYSVSLGGAGLANVLNMTYPAFVPFFALLLLKEVPSPKTLILVFLTIIGIILNISGSENVSGLPGQIIEPAAAWALASGILAAIAIVALRGASRNASSADILFWMFGLGSLALLPLAGPFISKISIIILPELILSAGIGVLGQWLLTISYRHISAITGSMISGTRIPIALLMGAFVLNESSGWKAWSGATLIFLSNLLLAFITKNEKHVARTDR